MIGAFKQTFLGSAGASTAVAEGGTETEVGGYIYHTFTSTANLEVFNVVTMEYMILAGGGSGGRVSSRPSATPGGAGGYRTFSTSVPVGTYVCTVGAGAAGVSADSVGLVGSNSSVSQTAGSGFATLTSTGGGGGCWDGSTGPTGGSGSGGSGDPDYYSRSSPGTGNAGGYSPAEGYNGGQAYSNGISNGGSAGAGGAGGNASYGVSGSPGAGATWLDGVTYGTGRADSSASNGGVNTGEGGSSGSPWVGGSGIIIFRYAI
tara:strand:- start:1084 stop:1866 length:783 start_codon:yes stop_codon:yes gene_type:complete